MANTTTTAALTAAGFATAPRRSRSKIVTAANEIIWMLDNTVEGTIYEAIVIWHAEGNGRLTEEGINHVVATITAERPDLARR